MDDNQNDIIAQYLEKDAEILKENGVHPKDPGQEGSITNRYWKFIGGFFALLLIGFIGIPLIGAYIERQEDKAWEEQNAQSDAVMRDLQERLKNDKDGGATAEETLQLFTTALKKGDIEQAEKYFVIYPEERQTMLIDRLEQIREEGKFEALLDALKAAKYMPKSSDEHVGIFRALGSDGMATLSIEITKDKYSSVWKIENIMF